MKLLPHATAGAILSVPVFVWSPSGALIAFLSTTLIDIDHLLFYSLHTGRIPLAPPGPVSAYKKWSYFGPRVQLLHNYETLLVISALAWFYGGLFVYAFLGIAIHLIMDQAEGYSRYRFFRIRSLAGDFFRYRSYRKALRAGSEKEYLVAWRDDWLGHLRHVFGEEKGSEIGEKCGIFNTYKETGIDMSKTGATWRDLL